MRTKHTLWMAIIVASVFVFLPTARAQSDQGGSVAEAAKASRAQKKASSKPAVVVTDDTLHPINATPSEDSGATGTNATVTTKTDSGAKPEDAAKDSSAPNPVAGKSSAKEDAEKKAKIDQLKQQIADLAKEVDLRQREFSLANEDFYSKPDFSKDTAGKERLEQMKSSLSSGQDELARLKSQLRDLGVDPQEKTSPAKP